MSAPAAASASTWGAWSPAASSGPGLLAGLVAVAARADHAADHDVGQVVTVTLAQLREHADRVPVDPRQVRGGVAEPVAPVTGWRARWRTPASAQRRPAGRSPRTRRSTRSAATAPPGCRPAGTRRNSGRSTPWWKIRSVSMPPSVTIGRPSELTARSELRSRLSPPKPYQTDLVCLYQTKWSGTSVSMPRDGSATRAAHPRHRRAAGDRQRLRRHVGRPCDRRVGHLQGRLLPPLRLKVALARALVERYAAADIAHLDQAVAQVKAATGDPAARVIAFLRVFEDGADELMAAQSSCLYVSVLTERQLASGRHRDQISRAVLAWRAELAAPARRGAGHPPLTPSPSTRTPWPTTCS